MDNVVQAEHVDSLEYFFKYVGGVWFHEDDITEVHSSNSVAVSTRFGITIFSDNKGDQYCKYTYRHWQLDQQLQPLQQDVPTLKGLVQAFLPLC